MVRYSGIAKDLVEAQTDTPAVINTFNAAGRPIAPFMTDLTEKYASKAVNKELSTTEFYNYAPYISKSRAVRRRHCNKCL